MTVRWFTFHGLNQRLATQAVRSFTETLVMKGKTRTAMVQASELTLPPRGVTLLELMLVVAVVVMLSAIAIPSYQGYVERSRSNQAVGEVGSIGLGIQQWEMNNGRLPASLAEAGYGGRFDPWGNLYQYRDHTPPVNKGQIRRDKNLNPVNTWFDLWSNGPDGNTQMNFNAADARDDIVWAADGAFVGKAEDF